jgi:GTP-binding protein
MKITAAEFVASYTDIRKCPAPDRAEFAFIGRSNVGKSSLINMITDSRHLAKTSGKPGKTQTINYFSINKEWYLVDLPGYGYANVSKSVRAGFGKMIDQYVPGRENMACLFVLIDIRLEPQPIDLDFIQWAGGKGIPLAIAFTKADKLTRGQTAKNVAHYKKALLQIYEELPPVFITSAETKQGKEEILAFIEEAIQTWESRDEEE